MKTFLVMLAIAICFSAYAAVDSRSGAWTAELVDGTTLQLSIFGRNEKNDRLGWGGSVMGFNAPVATFVGLSQTDAAASAANVRFELRRAAGTVSFDGRFSEGTGAGHFKFVPNDGFVREMESLGYSDFTDQQLLMFAVHDFTPQVIRDLRAMGYELSKREVEDIAVFRVTAELIRDYARLGFSNLTVREVVDLRVGRVDAEYVNAMRALGYSNLTAREISNMAILGVRPSYIRELQGAGLTSLSARELSDLRVGRVTAARIEEYRKLGYTNLSARQLSEMGIHGVTPALIEEYRALGYSNIPVRQLIEMKIFGVTPDYIRKLKTLGYSNVPADKLVKLKQSGLVK
jgi:hypothetical protein